MVCTVCNDFTRKVREYRILWDCTIQQLDEAARTACTVCSTLLEGITHFVNPNSVRKISVWGPSVDENQYGCLEVDVFMTDASEIRARRLQFFPATKTGTSNAMRLLYSNQTIGIFSFSLVHRKKSVQEHQKSPYYTGAHCIRGVVRMGGTDT